MRHTIALSTLALWGPITLAICRALGIRRGVLIGLLGGFLFLPRSPIIGWLPFGFLTLDRRTIPGLAALLAVVVFDRRTLARFRPSVIDLLPVGYLLAPLIASAAYGFRSPLGPINESWIHLAEWVLPYLVGRLYFVEGDGPRRLGTAVAVAGLLYVPLIVFEGVLGPDWYLAGQLYGIDYNHGMEVRLGGWRPETFLNNGLELGEWMALAATLGTWIWICSGWKPSPIPGWLPAPLLIFGSIAIRGVYGYAILAIGLVVTLLTKLLRVRLFLMMLTLVPPAYLAVRISGVWDGRSLVDLAGRAGNRGTVSIRIDAEDRDIAETRKAGLVFGQATRYPDWYSDGRWIATLRGSGLVGLVLHYGALLGPASILIWRRRSTLSPTSPEMGLALFGVLHAVDSLHNTALIEPAAILSGALAGVAIRRAGRPEPNRGGHATYRIPDGSKPTVVPTPEIPRLISTVLAIACLLYVFGHAPADGQDQARFVGGLGSALLFGAVGAAARSVRFSAIRLAGFALAFGWLGSSFNLALHPSDRPVGSADILQGMALCGLLVALWRPRLGGDAGAFAILGLLGASWWVLGGFWRPFPGSQYLFFSRDDGSSLFPVAPWLTFSAVGAILVGCSTARAWAFSIGFGLLAAMAWRGDWPIGSPSKFPLNPTYALLGASIASAAFAASGVIRRWSWSRWATEWLGVRWLIFFYLHLGITIGLGRAGLTQPLVCWTLTAVFSITATWLVSAGLEWVRGPFRHPATWIALGLLTIGVGLIPGIPPRVVQGIAGGVGVLFASRWGNLASMILGKSGESPEEVAPTPEVRRFPGWVGLAVLVLILVAPELVRRLPAPIGTAFRGPWLAVPSRPVPTP